ncbi:MAG: CDP-alcohol phosphatidyltransferase family protein [Thermodesulfobacteriota bacterium]|nr:CDP-alcohol phosphatidyltransferase family protein [Thermodesulfobacteriota bacterium]
MSQPRKKREFFNYFGEIEKKPVHIFASMRDFMFRGLSKWLFRHNVRPKQVTLLSFLVQLVFFPLFFSLGWWPQALTALLLHIFLDSLDGSLARTGQVASQSGALADMLNDVSGMAIVGLAVIFFGHENHPGLVTAYIILYLYMTLFLVALNIFGRQFPYIIRTKTIFFGFVFLKYWAGLDYMDIFLIVSIIYMVAQSAWAMARLFKTIDEIDMPENQSED